LKKKLEVWKGSDGYMSQSNLNFIKRLMKAGELEKEAILTLLPDKTRGHVEVIGNEIKEMIMETLVDQCFNGQKEADKEDSPEEKRVKKVDIE